MIYFFKLPVSSFFTRSLSAQYPAHNFKRVQATMKQSKLGWYGWSGCYWIVYLLQDMSWHNLPHTADPHCWESCMELDQWVFHWLFYLTADLLSLGPRKVHQSKRFKSTFMNICIFIFISFPAKMKH